MNPSFRGGIHITEHKNTRDSAIEKMPAPKIVKISLAQHSGAPMKPTVAPGDYVYRGQIIGNSDASISCPVHSSVSGKVTAIELINDAGRATPVSAVVIENDGLDTLDPSILKYQAEHKPVNELTADEVVNIVRAAGIVGLGGAVFPTYAKLKGSIGKTKTMLVNCAECEPYITADHRLMLEHPDEIMSGVDILIRTVGAKKAIIAIEDNKSDAARLLAEIAKERDDIEVRLLKTKYPQGDKSQIIYSLTKTEPTHGVRLSDIGYMIINAGTTAAVWRALNEGMPLIDRIVTVDGDCIANPKNVLAPIGTPIIDLIEFCGGLKKVPKKVINGGPMMGAAQWNMKGVVTKGTSALLAFSEEAENNTGLPTACINCGRCVHNCPMHLMPNYLAKLAKAKKYAACEDYNISDCIECGTCSYNCPGHVEIVQYIRVAKGALSAAAKK